MIKIGILLKNFNDLENYELRIIQKIFDDSELDLSLIIFDGRTKSKNPRSFKNKISRLIRSKNILGKLFYNIQYKIEKFIFKNKLTIDKKRIINLLNNIEKISLSPERKGFLDIFSIEDSQTIKNYKLDILLRHEFNIIRGDLLYAAKYGIWSFHHADNSINRGGPPGFWEVVLNEPNIGITLQQLTPELDGGLIIDKGFSNRTFSHFLNEKKVYEDSVSILFKNLNKLKNSEYNTSKSKTYYNILYKTPDFLYLTRYMLGFYSYVLNHFIKKFKAKFFKTRYNCWSLFIGKGNFLESTLFKLKPIIPPKNEFWADPFLINYSKNIYVFFENYSYKTKKGKISCGRIIDDKIVDITDVLNLDYHLSYPFLFKENDNIYMIPETNENRRLEIYKCVSFPDKWELYSTAFEDEIVSDAHFYIDENDQKWLFLNKRTQTTSVDLELYIYRVDSLKLNKIESHKQNPVIINSKIARNGGAIFKYNNDLIRPSQYNAEAIYGRGLNLNKISTLNLEHYKETCLHRVMPNFHKNLIGVHHLHQIDNMFIIDGCFSKI
jgi:hypothetical protein